MKTLALLVFLFLFPSPASAFPGRPCLGMTAYTQAMKDAQKAVLRDYPELSQKVTAASLPRVRQGLKELIARTRSVSPPDAFQAYHADVLASLTALLAMLDGKNAGTALDAAYAAERQEVARLAPCHFTP